MSDSAHLEGGKALRHCPDRHGFGGRTHTLGEDEGGDEESQPPTLSLPAHYTVPLFSQDNDPTICGPWVVTEGPRETHSICPGTPHQEQAGDLLPRASGKLPQGAGAAGGAGPPHDLRGPVGSGARVHAAQSGKEPAPAPAPEGWSVSARAGLGWPLS